MGMILMADDLSMIVGEIRGVTKALTERLDRQDAETIRNKAEAIAAREAKHKENKTEIRQLREAVDGTALVARDNAQWIEAEGKPLVTKVDSIHERVTAIEDGKRIEGAEERGAGKTWAFILAVGSAIGTAVAGVITYGRDAIDFLKGN